MLSLLALFHRHSGTRAKRAGPESITTVSEYGFRARGLKPAPRNDARECSSERFPLRGLATLPLLKQGGGWSAARRSLMLRVLAGRAVPGNRRALALRRSTAALRRIPEDPALPRTALPGTRTFLPCPSPASSSQGGPSAARAGLRGRPSARVRASSAGTDPDPTSNTSRDAPLVDRDGAELKGARRSADKVFAEIFEVVATAGKFRAGQKLYQLNSTSFRPKRRAAARRAGTVISMRRTVPTACPRESGERGDDQ